MKLKIAVIFGGRSVEHEISILSALQTIKALDQKKFIAIPIYITKDGQWYTGDKLLSLKNYQNIELLLHQCQKIIVNQNAGQTNWYYEPKNIFTSRKPIMIDIAFPVTHGCYGEDGTLAGLFETMNIPYVGCDLLSSSIAMDKVATKKYLQAAKIKMLDYYTFYSEEWINQKDRVLATLKNKFNYPLIVKPNNLGSSIGVTAVKDEHELEDAIDLAISLSTRVIVEPKINQYQEINCAVLGNREEAKVSVCEELFRTGDILTYQDKYTQKTKCPNKISSNNIDNINNTNRKIPADLPHELTTKIQTLAKQAFVELNCNGVVRVDFLIDQANNEIFLGELNTIPGSLAFYLWQPLGMDFTELTTRLIELARKRHQEHNNLLTTFSQNLLHK